VATKDRRIADLTKKILGATESAKTRGEQAAEQLKEKLADGDWTSAGGRLGNYSTFVSILGMGDVLRGQKDGWARIEQYAYGQAFKCIANPFGLSSFKIAVPAAYLLVLDEQSLLTRYLALASKDEKRGFTNQTFAANFVAALAGRASGELAPARRRGASHARVARTRNRSPATAGWKRCPRLSSDSRRESVRRGQRSMDRSRPPHVTIIATASPQSRSPSFVHTRTRNRYVPPGVSPAIPVFACIVTGTSCQVTPPSSLHCHP
jgi:hypothetical protein